MSATIRPRDEEATVEISGVAYDNVTFELSQGQTRTKTRTHFEDIRCAVKVVDVFDWDHIEERELAPLRSGVSKRKICSLHSPSRHRNTE